MQLNTDFLYVILVVYESVWNDKKAENISFII
jgi:hypothetical protein